MTKASLIYTVRIIIGLIFVAVACLACQVLLDTESLTNKEAKDDAAVDATKDAPKPIDSEAGVDLLPPDRGFCVPDEVCEINNLVGICKFGKTVCSEGGLTGYCLQTTTPGQVAETCDGQDQNCNAVADEVEEAAHASCGAGQYCSGSACAGGCWKQEHCTNGNSCTNHQCLCGSQQCTGNYVCEVNLIICVCGSNHLQCGPGEECLGDAGGTCGCGSVTSTTGKACQVGTCINNECATPPDAGPDLQIPDMMLPDIAVADQAVADQAVPDQAVPDQAIPDQAIPDQALSDSLVLDLPKSLE